MYFVRLRFREQIYQGTPCSKWIPYIDVTYWPLETWEDIFKRSVLNSFTFIFFVEPPPADVAKHHKDRCLPCRNMSIPRFPCSFYIPIRCLPYRCRGLFCFSTNRNLRNRMLHSFSVQHHFSLSKKIELNRLVSQNWRATTMILIDLFHKKESMK